MAATVASSPNVTWPVTWRSCRPESASRSRQRGTGEDGHLDVVRLGIAEAEDPGAALGASALVARRAGGLEDQHAPAPAGQGPRRGEAEHPCPHHDALAVVGHASIIRTASAVPRGRRARRYARQQ